MSHILLPKYNAAEFDALFDRLIAQTDKYIDRLKAEQRDREISLGTHPQGCQCGECRIRGMYEE